MYEALHDNVYSSVCCDRDNKLAWDETRLEYPCKKEHCLKLYECKEGQYFNGGNMKCEKCPRGFLCKYDKEPELCPTKSHCKDGKAKNCDNFAFCDGPGFYEYSTAELPLIGKYKSICGSSATHVDLEGSAKTFKCIEKICTIKGYVSKAGDAEDSTCTCSKGFYFQGSEGCSLCPVGFYCNGESDEPTLCDRGYYCDEGEKYLCSHNDCPDVGMVKASLLNQLLTDPFYLCRHGFCPDVGMAKASLLNQLLTDPFYTSVCHKYASGAFKTFYPHETRTDLNRRNKACLQNSDHVSVCLRNFYRNRGKCQHCLPGYVCPGKYTFAPWFACVETN